jgi:DNA-directed RNA polymerase beta subunit
MSEYGKLYDKGPFVEIEGARYINTGDIYTRMMNVPPRIRPTCPGLERAKNNMRPATPFYTELFSNYMEKFTPIDTLLQTQNFFAASVAPRQLSLVSVDFDDYYISLEDPRYVPPGMTMSEFDEFNVDAVPSLVLQRGGVYSADLKVDIVIRTTSNNEEVARRQDVLAAKVPIMIGTELDNVVRWTKEYMEENDIPNTSENFRLYLSAFKEKYGQSRVQPGGWFISEKKKIIKMTDKIVTNKILVIENNGSIEAITTPYTYQGTSKLHINMNDNLHVVNIGALRIGEKIVKSQINLFIPLRFISAMQRFNEEEYPDDAWFIEHVLSLIPDKSVRRKADVSLRMTLSMCEQMTTIELKEKIRSAFGITYSDAGDIADRLRESIFPQVDYANIELEDFNVNSSRLNMLAYILVRFYMVRFGDVAPNDRSHTGNKRIKTPAAFFESEYGRLLRTKYYNGMISSLKNLSQFRSKQLMFDQVLNLAQSHLSDKSIVHALERLISDGAGFGDNKKNVEVLDEKNSSDTFSHLLRLNPDVSRHSTTLSLRTVHPSQIGAIDPIQTPESDAAGLTEYLTVVARISVEESADNLIEGLEQHIWRKRSKGAPDLIIVNGIALGWCDKNTMYRRIRRFKRDPHYRTMSCIVTDVAVEVFTDSGRMLYPILIVDKNTMRPKIADWNGPIDWEELFNRGYIEYHQPGEPVLIFHEESDIAPIEKRLGGYGMSLHPSQMFGFSASVSPNINSSSSVRSAYQAGMGRQAVKTMIGGAFNVATTTREMIFPDQPIYLPVPMRHHILGASGGNLATVLVTPFETGTSEDAVALSEFSRDRGYAFYQTKRVFKQPLGEERLVRDKKATIYLGKPRRVYRGKSLAHIGEDGLPKIGSYIVPGMIILGVIAVFDNGDIQDVSVAVTSKNDYGYVTHVSVMNDMGNYNIRVELTRVTVPAIGNKFHFPYAQKGVIGQIVPNSKALWSPDGQWFDIYMSPVGIVGRMTIGFPEELILSMWSIEQRGARQINATAFDDRRIDASLHEKMLSLIEPRTGEKLLTSVLCGKAMHYSVGHIAAEKLQSGGLPNKFNSTTRMPINGLNAQLKNGEMEMEAVMTTGAADFFIDKNHVGRGLYQIPICQTCGTLATWSPVTQSGYVCRGCSEKDRMIYRVSAGYQLVLNTETMRRAGVDFVFGLEEQDHAYLANITQVN